jgi:hypothetical protein
MTLTHSIGRIGNSRVLGLLASRGGAQTLSILNCWLGKYLATGRDYSPRGAGLAILFLN